MKAPPFHISPGTEVRVRGQLQVIDKISDSGLVTLVCPLRHTELQFELHELVTMRMDSILTPVLSEPTTHQVACPPAYTPQSQETRARVARRIAYAQFAAALYPIGPHSSRLKAAISDVAQRHKDDSPPSPHSVYRWVTRYVTSGYDTAVFMQDCSATRTRRKRQVTDEVSCRLREHITELLGAFKGATLHGITNLALAKTAKDLGHLTFVTKEGVEEEVGPFIEVAVAAQSVPKPPKVKKPKKGAN
jgi:hypothetical protein